LARIEHTLDLDDNQAGIQRHHIDAHSPILDRAGYFSLGLTSKDGSSAVSSDTQSLGILVREIDDDEGGGINGVGSLELEGVISHLSHVGSGHQDGRVTNSRDLSGSHLVEDNLLSRHHFGESRLLDLRHIVSKESDG